MVANTSYWRGLDETFSYDDNGNRTESTTEGVSNGITDTGSYNRLEEDADWTYLYDREGNLTKKTAQVGGAYTIYSWDHRNRLAKVENYNSSAERERLIDYTHDAGNQLVNRQVQDFWIVVGPMESGYEDPINEYYVNHDNDRALTFNTNGDLARRYVQGPLTDQLLFDEVFDAAGEETGFFAPAADHLGTVRAVLNELEAVHQFIDYDSYGQVSEIRDVNGDLIGSGFLGPYQPDTSALDTVFGHAGRPLDSATGLSSNGARWYDPATGRFLSEDPTGFADGPNPYRFAGNDPVNFSDPTGLSQAGNPLNNLVGRPSKSGGISTSSLINSLSSPSRTPSVKDFASVVLTAPSYDPLGASSLPNQFASDVQAYRSAQSNQFFQDLIGPDYRNVALGSRTPMQKITQMGDVGSQFTPGVSDARDVYELSTGRDLISGEKLTGFQYAVTAVGAVLPIVGGWTLRGLFEPITSGPIATTAPGKNFIPSTHLQAAAGEYDLIQQIQKTPAEVILQTNRTVTSNGADVISFNQKNGQVTLWDNKSTVGNRPRVDGTRSP